MPGGRSSTTQVLKQSLRNRKNTHKQLKLACTSEVCFLYLCHREKLEVSQVTSGRNSSAEQVACAVAQLSRAGFAAWSIMNQKKTEANFERPYYMSHGITATVVTFTKYPSTAVWTVCNVIPEQKGKGPFSNMWDARRDRRIQPL